jgi:hypothetical protein
MQKSKRLSIFLCDFQKVGCVRGLVLTEPEELLHDLREILEGNIATLIAVHQITDMSQFRIVQITPIQIMNAGLELLPSDRAGFQSVVLVEDLGDGDFVPAHLMSLLPAPLNLIQSFSSS